MIYIYSGHGTSRESIEHTTLAFKEATTHTIKLLDEQQLISGEWLNSSKLIIFPGGADVPYVRKLNGKGNQVIKNYVEQGGSFLGLCAGAYYASGYVEFDQNGPLEVLGERELAFFPGKTIGPILAPYDYHSKIGARAAFIEMHKQKKRLHVFCSGGPYFKDAQMYENVEILASYQLDQDEQLPAIIKMNPKEGTVILSGVHFEYNPELLNNEDPYLKEIIPAIQKTDYERKMLIREMAKELRLALR